MKYILFFAAAVLFSACSHGHKHEGHDHAAAHQHADGSACGCSDKDAKAAHHHEAKDHKCDKCEGKADKCDKCAAAAAPAEWNINGITQAEFKTAYTKRSAELGKVCTAAAQEYCGKTTKDMGVTEEEVTCLLAKTQRVTREVLPKLDKTPCAKVLKQMSSAKKK